MKIVKTPVLTPEDSEAIVGLAAVAFMLISVRKGRGEAMEQESDMLAKLAKFHFDQIPHLARILKPKVEAFLETLTKETRKIEDIKL